MQLEKQAFTSKRAAAPDLALQRLLTQLHAGALADLLDKTPVYEGADAHDDAGGDAASDGGEPESAEEPES
jgi:hypothetical protein